MSLWLRHGEAVVDSDPDLAARLERSLVQRLDRAEGARRARRRMAVWGAGTLAAVAAVLVLWLGFGGVLVPVAAPETVVVTTGTQAQEVSLPHDGRLVVAMRSRVRLHASRDAGAVVELHQGEVSLDVRWVPGARWRVRTGAFEVEAIGTRFRVRHTGKIPQVHVDEGIVRLTGPGLPEEGVRIQAGESQPSRPEPILVPEPPEPETPEPEAKPSRPRLPSWVSRFRAAIQRGDSKAAVAALPASFPERGSHLRASDYLDAGDALAAAGDPRADQSYRTACKGARGSKACGIATFRRALLRGRAGDRKGAIELTSQYLEAHPDGSLAREALGRRMRWRWDSGRQRSARSDAERYLERWPDGPLAPFAARITSK